RLLVCGHDGRRHGRYRWHRLHGRDRGKCACRARSGFAPTFLGWGRHRPGGERPGWAMHIDAEFARPVLRHCNQRRADDCAPHPASARPAPTIPAQRNAHMIDVSSLALLRGKKALVTGIANDQSIAWGCAKAFRAFGADVAITYLNEKARHYVEPLAKELDAP